MASRRVFSECTPPSCDLGTTHFTRNTVSTIHSGLSYLLQDDVWFRYASCHGDVSASFHLATLNVWKCVASRWICSRLKYDNVWLVSGSVPSAPPNLSTKRLAQNTVSTIHSGFCYLVQDDVWTRYPGSHSDVRTSFELTTVNVW